MPTWSNDGRWIYFCSNRSGTNQIWRVPANCGEAEQITQHGGLDSCMSKDGSYLYYTQGFQKRSVWRVPATGGVETEVVDSTVSRGLALGSKGLFYATPMDPRGDELRYLDFATNIARPLFVFSNKVIPPISFGGNYLYFSQYGQITSNLMNLEHFQ